jgi:DNA-binding transcriptional ArsR family regulator
MPNQDPDLVFRALADPTRRRVLEMLAAGERKVGDIQDAFALSQPAISQHLKVLREARLVTTRWEGRERYYRTDGRPIKAVLDWADHFSAFWAKGLMRIGDVLREEEQRGRQRKRPAGRRR